MLTRDTPRRIHWDQLAKLLQNQQDTRVAPKANHPPLPRVHQAEKVIPLQNMPIDGHLTRAPFLTTHHAPLGSSMLRVQPPIIHALPIRQVSPLLHPPHVIGRLSPVIRRVSPVQVRLSPPRVVTLEARPAMKGSFIFNYQTKVSQVLRPSLPMHNKTVVY